MHRTIIFAFSHCLVALVSAQFAIGVQGGPLLSRGAWEAQEELSDTRGWQAGMQLTEGRRGERGFRVGLEAGQRGYTIRANSPDGGIREEFEAVSTMLWLSFEIRWPLSKRHRIFFDLGPVIGFELHEQRAGVRFYEGYDYQGRYWSKDRIAASEQERGLAIRDGRWRLGVSAEWPVAPRWMISTGAHLSPGVGSWAMGHGYATLDASARLGVLYALSGKRKYR